MISVSKNMFLDKLGHIFNKYNNTYYSTTKIKPVDVKWSTYIEFIAKKQYVRIFWWSCKNIKIWKIVQKVTLQTGLKKILWLKKLEILVIDACYYRS